MGAGSRPTAAFAAFAVAWATLAAGCADASGTSEDALSAGRPGGPGLDLRGVVVDEALRPVAGADVTAGDGRGNRTGADGAFLLPGMAAGVHVVRAAKSGYADATTQVLLAAGEEPPLVKLVLLADASTLAYVEALSIDGLVECGVSFIVGYFAACSVPNTALAIACPATGVCLGNVTGDRSLILQPVAAPPDWIQMEAFWEPTAPTSEVMMVQSGAATPEEISVGSVRIINETVGPSPNVNVIAGEDLDESGIGVDALMYMRLHTAPNPPAGAGMAVQQPFRLIVHLFYGYHPPDGWRFSSEQQVPAPPG